MKKVVKTYSNTATLIPSDEVGLYLGEPRCKRCASSLLALLLALPLPTACWTALLSSCPPLRPILCLLLLLEDYPHQFSYSRTHMLFPTHPHLACPGLQHLQGCWEVVIWMLFFLTKKLCCCSPVLLLSSPLFPSLVIPRLPFYYYIII